MEVYGNLPFLFLRNKEQPLLYTVPQQKSLIKWEGITSTTAVYASHQRKLRIQKQLLSFGNWVNDLSGRLHWMKHKLWTCNWWFSKYIFQLGLSLYNSKMYWTEPRYNQIQLWTQSRSPNVLHNKIAQYNKEISTRG